MASASARFGAFALTSVSALFAAAFWEESDPETWTRQQVEELLSDSPWAQPAEVRFTGDRGGSGLPGIGLPGGRGRTGGGTRIPGGSPWPGAGGGVGFPHVSQARQAAFDADATVVWTSALPVRQALARMGIVEELRDAHARDFFIVTIDGLPPAMAHLADQPDVFRQSARLERRGRPAIQATRVEVRPRPGAAGIELYFPRDESVAADGKTIEVAVTAEDYSIRRKFKLSEMVYRGRLEM